LLNALQTSIQSAHQAIASVQDVALEKTLLSLVDNAFIDGIYHTMILGCVMSVLSGALAIFLLPKTVKSPEA